MSSGYDAGSLNVKFLLLKADMGVVKERLNLFIEEVLTFKFWILDLSRILRRSIVCRIDFSSPGGIGVLI